jgi:hypothetical protein
VVKDIYNFHSRHERYFNKLKSTADILLVRGDSNQEFRGLLRMLTAEHLLFDMMEAWCIDQLSTPRKLEEYKLVVLADAASLSDGACQRLDAFVKAGGKILATGGTSTLDEIGAPQHRFRLEAAGLKPDFEVHEKKRGTYLHIFPEDKEVLGDGGVFDDLDILYVWGDFLRVRLETSAKGHLGLIPNAMYGPPEKCYYEDVTRIPGLISNQFGKGRFAYLPWPVGAMYEHRSHHGHHALVKSVIRNVLDYSPRLEVEASPLLEVAHQVAQDRAFEWIGLANHSGQVGTAFHAPIPIRNVVIRYKKTKVPRAVRLLRSDQQVRSEVDPDGSLLIRVPELRDFEVVVLEW